MLRVCVYVFKVSFKLDVENINSVIEKPSLDWRKLERKKNNKWSSIIGTFDE